MAIARFGRQVKRSYQSYGFCVKLSVVVILGMCFVFVWSAVSNFSVTYRRESFDDIVEPVYVSAGKVGNSQINSGPKNGKESGKQRFKSGLDDKDKKNVNGSVVLKPEERPEKVESAGVERRGDDNLKSSKGSGEEKNEENDGSEVKEVTREEEEDEGNDKEGEELESDSTETKEAEGDPDLVNAENLDQETLNEEIESSVKKKKKKNLGPLFDPKASYTWKLCNTRSKYNYIPCIDIESGTGKIQSYRHHERSCPRSDVMCLVPLPRDGYGEPEHWPESKVKV